MKKLTSRPKILPAVFFLLFKGMLFGQAMTSNPSSPSGTGDTPPGPPQYYNHVHDSSSGQYGDYDYSYNSAVFAQANGAPAPQGIVVPPMAINGVNATASVPATSTTTASTATPTPTVSPVPTTTTPTTINYNNYYSANPPAASANGSASPNTQLRSYYPANSVPPNSSFQNGTYSPPSGGNLNSNISNSNPNYGPNPAMNSTLPGSGSANVGGVKPGGGSLNPSSGYANPNNPPITPNYVPPQQ